MILAAQYPVFQPAMRIISSIVSGHPLVVITTFPHQYTTGMIARLHIPEGFGMPQANNIYGPITVITPISFEIAIEAEELQPFVPSVVFPYNKQYAQVTVIGEVNRLLTAAERNVLPY